jgi:hypothetical protein
MFKLLVGVVVGLMVGYRAPEYIRTGRALCNECFKDMHQAAHEDMEETEEPAG